MILSKPINNSIKVKVNTILKAAKRRADNYFDENIKSKIKDLDNYDSLLILAKEREVLKKKISKSEYIFYIEYASSPQWLISQYASRTFLLNVDESDILEEAAFLEKYRSNIYKAIDKIKKGKATAGESSRTLNKLKNLILLYTNAENMTNNKLAVEWLAKSYVDLLTKLNNEEISLKEFEIQYIELLEQAKEMEKEIMIQFCIDWFISREMNIREYYDKTYGGGEQ